MESKEWKLLVARDVANSNPDFFVHPLLSFEQRCMAQIGETVKVTASVKAKDWKLRGIWLTVEDNSSAPVVFVGRPRPEYRLRLPSDSDCTFEFGPQHIYRMEPRDYKVWGRSGEPVMVWGRGRPESLHDVPIPNLEPLHVFASPIHGWQNLERHYTKLAKDKSWPSFDELRDRTAQEIA